MKRIAVITFLTCSVLQSFSQAKESTILKAMQDELDRNMKELKYGDFEKPFFISYTLTDVYQFEVAASMGSLLRSVKTPLKNHNVRVLVGDYAFNDESLDGNSSFQGAEANEVPLPVDDDYYGIRRSFWAMTDYVYKGAARQFKQNQQSVKEKKKNLDEIPHRHFAKLPPVQIRETAIPYAFDARSMEKLVASVSAEFLNYTDLENSSVFLSFQDGYKYLVNSEGTSAIYPEQTFTLYAVASLRTEQGEQLSETLMFSGFTPADLPAATAIMAEIKMLYDRLKGRADLPTLAFTFFD